MSQDTNDKEETLSLNSPIYKLSGYLVYIIDTNGIDQMNEYKKDIEELLDKNRCIYQKWYMEKNPEYYKQYDGVFDDIPELYGKIYTPIHLLMWYLYYVKRRGHTPIYKERRCLYWKNADLEDLIGDINYDNKNGILYGENSLLVLIDKNCKKTINDICLKYDAKEFDLNNYIDILDVSVCTNYEIYHEYEETRNCYEEYKDIENIAIEKYNEYVENTKH